MEIGGNESGSSHWYKEEVCGICGISNFIRKMNSYTTNFTYSLTMLLFWKIGASKICKQTIKWGQEKQDVHVTC